MNSHTLWMRPMQKHTSRAAGCRSGVAYALIRASILLFITIHKIYNESDHDEVTE